MDDLLKVGIPALVALVGTLTTTFVGYRQWKRQQDETRLQRFETDRRAVCEKLWNMLEDVHVKVRTDTVGRRKFDELVRQVNSFILKNSLYIEKTDGTLASQYLDSVFIISQMVAQSRNKGVQRE